MTDPPVATRASEDSGEHNAAQATQASARASGSWRNLDSWRGWGGRAATLARQNWLACLLMAAGLVLRVLAQLAYRPALVYVDTLKYLYGVYPGSDPLGYKLPLKIILAFGDLGLGRPGLGAVAAVQHLLGLAMAAVLYILLRRRGVNRWLAAIAMAPVLLDAYQLQMEQTIMPDVWFEAMLVAGLALLLWRPAVTMPLLVAAGLVLGASATMRQLGELLIFPVVLFGLVAWGGWRRVLIRSAAVLGAFALPILLYCGVNYARTGHFWLAHGQTTLGRVTAAADCATLKVPADVRRLCPAPGAQALGPDWLEHSGKSPLYTTPPHGPQKTVLLKQLTSAIRSQQPLRIAGAVARDAVRLFALTRDPVESVTPISRWQFQDSYPVYPHWVTLRQGTIIVGLQRRAFGMFHFSPLNPSYGGKARVIRPLAEFLRGYQLNGGYTPGPLYLVASLLGLAGSVLLLIRRRLPPRAREAALACLLFTAAAVVLLFAPNVFEFSWRYELPAVVVLPPAGALGLCALWSWRRDRRRPPADGQPAAQAQA